MHNREFKFGYQHFLLCQKFFLKVSSKWLLKNKSDNGKLLLGKTYSGERFRAILALLYNIIYVYEVEKLCKGEPCLMSLSETVQESYREDKKKNKGTPIYICVEMDLS